MSFISAGPADPLENLKPKRVTLNDTEILLIRDGENVYAGSADCPHKGALLEDGAVCRGKLVCPWHKGTFDIASADVCEPPALTGLSRYAVEIRDGEVLVDPEQATDSTDKRQNRLTAVNAHSHIVIVGAGAAGAAALQSLVNNRYHGRITVVDPEADAPYDRTLLTKAVTAGDMEPDEVDPLVNQDDMDITEVTRLVAKVSELILPPIKLSYMMVNRWHTIDYLLPQAGSPSGRIYPALICWGSIRFEILSMWKVY